MIIIMDHNLRDSIILRVLVHLLNNKDHKKTLLVALEMILIKKMNLVVLVKFNTLKKLKKISHRQKKNNQ